ncbi:MAG: orotidine-5'-phosphate decarboxylase [Candidatus Anstonellaceae archaeon]
MSYYKMLEKFSNQSGNILCFGLDPVIEKIPSEIEGSIKQRIVKFYSSIIQQAGNRVKILKPNYAFFAQYGIEGIFALKELIDSYKESHLIILDAKRADIANTSKAYVKEIFEFFGAHATTIWPFMGSDSVEPFLTYCLNNSAGAYILCRTSNPSAEEFFAKRFDGQFLYEYIAQKAQQWAELYPQSVGLVVGATAPEDLENILKQLKTPLSLLIPGVGKQGGDAKKIMQILKEYRMERLSVINVSSSISYEYINSGQDYLTSALEQIEKYSEMVKLD